MSSKEINVEVTLHYVEVSALQSPVIQSQGKEKIYVTV